MTLRSDHKALAFLGAIAVLGAGVRVARATGRSAAPQQPALEHQIQASDSARRAAGAKKRGRKPPSAGRIAAAAPASGVPADRGHLAGRLDLDVATAAQIDSLPGMSPALARRIVADRMTRGPFTKPSALRRVRGVTAKVMERVDSLVVFSGTIVPPNPADTVISRAKRARSVVDSTRPGGLRRAPPREP